MRILYLSPRQACPPTSGARLRDFHFARSLAERFPLTYLYFGDERSAALTRAQIGSASVEAIPRPRRYTPGKILQGLYGRWPLPVLNYTSPEMARAIRNALERERFDVVHLESLHMGAYLPAIRRFAPQAVTVLDWHNIESELMDRYADGSRSLLKPAYARFAARQLYRLEGLLLTECSGHLVCSGREHSLLSKRNPRARIALLPNGVDSRHFRPAPEEGQARDKLVFVGQMSYHANVEGAVWFAHEIWPSIHARFPQLTLSIVGSDPAAAVLALRKPGLIEITGTVPDVLPFYQDAFASVVPLLTGGGTRLKILEAMAAGTPVISTAIGAEGLRVTHGENIVLADKDPESWLNGLAAIARNRKELTRKARELVAAEYDWANIGTRLAATYEDWVSG